MARTLDEHLFGPGPKRILSLDGGGVRGLITLGLLKRVEDLLAGRSADPRAFRLSDYFDLIGGTSTGAIIATLLAFGQRVEDVTRLYFDLCPQIFSRRTLLSFVFLRPRFDSAAFRRVIDATFDQILVAGGQGERLKRQKRLVEEPTLGSPLLKTGLAIVMKRIDSPSVWAVTNNPKAKYWDMATACWRPIYEVEAKGNAVAFDANRDYALRRLVRASASAPFYLDAVEVPISTSETGLFLDGGVTPFNNPCQELFFMTTLKARGDGGNGQGLSPFGFNWSTGANQLILLSLGTGTWRPHESIRDYKRQPEIKRGVNALASMISDCGASSVAWLQALSQPRVGAFINRNLGDMGGLHLLSDPLLTFRRVSPILEPSWLEQELGPRFSGISERRVERLRELDWAQADNLKELHGIGVAMAQNEHWLGAEDFPSAFDIPAVTQPSVAS
jgi:hypothetical protein